MNGTIGRSNYEYEKPYILGNDIKDMADRKMYLRKARAIEKGLSTVWQSLGKARSFVGQLRVRLRAFGQY